MTEGQYESGDKREREKVAAKKGYEVKKVGRKCRRVGKRAGKRLKQRALEINKTKQIIVTGDLRENLKAKEIKRFYPKKNLPCVLIH